VDLLQKQIATLLKSESDLTSDQGKASGDLGKANQCLADTNTELEGNRKSKLDNESYCETSANTFASNMDLINNDLDGLAEAIKTLDSKNPSWKATSFLQISSSGMEPQKRVSQLLEAQGKKLHSKILLKIAEVAATDPLASVKSKIKDLIEKLKKEVADEDGKSIECSEMMSKNKALITETAEDKKTAGVSKDALTAERKQNIQKREMQQETKQMMEDTLSKGNQMRLDEKTDNEAAIAEAEKQAELLGQAVEILSKTASGKAALVQQDPVAERAASGGLIGAIAKCQEIQTQQLDLSANIKAAEATAAQSWDESRKALEGDVHNAKLSISNLTAAISQGQDDIWNANETLRIGTEEWQAAVDDRDNRIKPQCIEMAALRQRNRKQELQSLTDALTILSNV